MKIVFSEVEKWEEKILKKGLKNHKVSFVKSPIYNRTVGKVKGAEVLGVFIHTKITKELLDKLPKLRLIIAMSVGYDHIDIEACRRRGVVVCNVPDYGSNTVAEHAFGLILTLTRKLHKAVEKTRKGEFDVKGLMGVDLHGRTLGVVGVGRIGKEMIRIGKGFGMEIIAVDRSPEKKLSKRLGFKFVGLRKLLRESDIVSLHVPLVKSTHHLINNDTIKLMKKGSYLINTARGAVVDVQALKKALDKSVLAGAGLDVLEGEGDVVEEKELLKKRMSKERLKDLKTNHDLLKKQNVIITPHSAFYSEEAIERILSSTISIIQGFCRRNIKDSKSLSAAKISKSTVKRSWSVKNRIC